MIIDIMYTHVGKDGSIVRIPNQAKQAIDHTIQANNKAKKKIKLERDDMIGQSVDRWLYDIKWQSTFMPKAPRKQ